MACQPVRDLTSTHRTRSLIPFEPHSTARLTDVVLPHVVAVPDGLLSRFP